MAGDAILEKEQAEQEANECRKQAERMLEITQQLSEKNSFLSSQCEVFRSQVRVLFYDSFVPFYFI